MAVNNTSQFLVSFCYRITLSIGMVHPAAVPVWGITAPPKILAFLWLVSKNDILIWPWDNL